MRLSYLSSFVVVVLGVTIGWYVSSVNNVVLWIVSALWGGYTASNVLKWYWWRFNGYGYFWGMVTGIGASLVAPVLLPNVSPINAFPLILVISLVGCFAGTLLTKPEDDEVLKVFYRRVRPWGFWGPIVAKVLAEDPSFQPNRDFLRDAFNIVIGICWQVSLVALPIYIVIRKTEAAIAAASVAAVTSLILKRTWYDRLSAREIGDSGATQAKSFTGAEAKATTV